MTQNMFSKITPKLSVASIERDIKNDEPFIAIINEDVFEFAILPVFKTLRKQLFGGDCDSEAETKRAIDYLSSKKGQQLRACLYDYTAMELLQKAASINNIK